MFTVAVVGCGIIGLSTAAAIQSHIGPKVRVVIFAEKLSPYTTGDVSAGLWTPYLLQDTPENKIYEWSKKTHDYMLQLWKEGEAKDAGVSILPLIHLYDENNHFRLPEWLKLALGYSELTEHGVKYYSEKYSKPLAGGYTYVTFTLEPSKFLPYLQQKFVEKGGEIKICRIENFNELSDFDVVVNCTGLYSRILVPDSSVDPIRGQVARVSAPWQFHGMFMDADCDNYIIPNQNCVILGGTHQEGNFSTEACEDDKRAILMGCYQLAPSLEKATVIKHSAGLRPGRTQVRLELEHRRVGNNKIMKIVHNYGHGGSGITLSIGCAQDAVQLVKQALGLTSQSKL